MEFNKKGILGRAAEAQKSTVVMDEGLRSYMLKVYNYMASGILLTGVFSILGVLIFVGLTAYDTQKIKNMYAVSDTGELMGKKAVMGALTLYLDFINLFIMLLRLFGQRR